MSYISKHTGSDIDTGITNIQQIFDLIYPIGSYYMSSVAMNPETLFGGTWEQITDRMIMAAGSSYTVNTTGGTATHTHTSAAHTHDAGSISPQIYIGSSGLIYDWGSPSVSRTFTPKWKTTFSGASDIQYTTSQNTTGVPCVGNTGSTTPGDTGSSSNLPPYIVAYIWRRTA